MDWPLSTPTEVPLFFPGISGPSFSTSGLIAHHDRHFHPRRQFHRNRPTFLPLSESSGLLLPRQCSLHHALHRCRVYLFGYWRSPALLPAPFRHRFEPLLRVPIQRPPAKPRDRPPPSLRRERFRPRSGRFFPHLIPMSGQLPDLDDGLSAARSTDSVHWGLGPVDQGRFLDHLADLPVWKVRCHQIDSADPIQYS